MVGIVIASAVYSIPINSQHGIAAACGGPGAASGGCLVRGPPAVGDDAQVSGDSREADGCAEMQVWRPGPVALLNRVDSGENAMANRCLVRLSSQS